ncbi:MAG: hypothetical protein AAFR64_01190 [Pseudomonadota bacterium]
MFYSTASDSPLSVLKATPIDLFEGDTMLDPKWGIFAVALGIFALAASYSVQLGLAVGIGIVAVAAIFLWVQLRFAFQPGESPADRSALTRRFNRLGRNRRAAQAAAESGSQAGTDVSEGS